jgi:hypothetical protein
MFQSQITTNDFKNLKSKTTEQKKFIHSYNNCKNDSKNKNKNEKERPKSESSLKTQLDKIKEKLYIEKMNKRYTSYKKRNNIKFIKK